jgi:hypothetical protein
MKVFQKSFAVALATVVVWFGYVNVSLAQIAPDPVGDGGGDLITWVTTMLTWLIALAGIVAAAVLIFNGFMYITASGDEGRIAKATKGITYAIIGLIIAAIAFLIVNFVIGQIDDSKASNEVVYSQVL